MCAYPSGHGEHSMPNLEKVLSTQPAQFVRAALGCFPGPHAAHVCKLEPTVLGNAHGMHCPDAENVRLLGA